MLEFIQNPEFWAAQGHARVQILFSAYLAYKQQTVLQYNLYTNVVKCKINSLEALAPWFSTGFHRRMKRDSLEK